MRTEQEMFDIIMGFAEKDERVRAVGMNGSRTNSNVPKDIFQDFDIVYIVTDLESFVDDPTWIDIFGERIILQTPNNMPLFSSGDNKDGFAYLMLFTDGNRIDLSLCPIQKRDNWNGGDKLSIILLDKDEALPNLPAPTDEDYRVQVPSAEFFSDCCNEFWWVSTYIVKGLWRREILYAQDHLNLYVRPMLLKMLEWQVGVNTNFSLSIGKNGKYLEKYLDQTMWGKLMSTYANGTYEGVWDALFAMVDLFRTSALEVAEQLKFSYPYEEDKRVSSYLQHIKNLPAHATDIY